MSPRKQIYWWVVMWGDRLPGTVAWWNSDDDTPVLFKTRAKAVAEIEEEDKEEEWVERVRPMEDGSYFFPDTGDVRTLSELRRDAGR